MNKRKQHIFKSWIGLIVLITCVAAGAEYTLGSWVSVISAVFFRAFGVIGGLYSMYHKYKELNLK